jgi:hypothetical protein
VDAEAFDKFQSQTDAALTDTRRGIDALGQGLDGKVDHATLQNALEAKLDTKAFATFRTQTNNALAAKVDTRTFDEVAGSLGSRVGTLERRVDDVEIRVPRMVDLATFEAFQDDVNKQLSTKVEIADFNRYQSEVATTFDSKADAATLDAFRLQVNSSLSTKLDSSAFNQFTKSVDTSFSTLGRRVTQVEQRVPR